MYSEGFGEKTQIESKQVRSQSREISCALGNASPAKTSFFRLLKQNQVRESSLLGPQVKLRFDWKYDRCGQVSSCRIESFKTFRTLGSPPIYTPPPPSLAGGCSKNIF